MKTVIIMGSSRNDGNTKKLVTSLCEKTGWDIVNLSNYTINAYDYNYNNSSDDYLPLINKIIERYDLLIFATPVYWYAMSSTMKVFFDRFTDLLTIEKTTGRKLRNKKMAAISVSTGDNLGDNFWLPFIATAHYLGMDYKGNLHTIEGAENELDLDNFIIRMKL